MTWHDVAIILHLVLFVYWLGADVGVFYASRFVTNPELSTQARGVALKIVDVIDMAPRVCLVLILPSGVTLMATSGYGRDVFAGWPVAAIWVAGLAWLALVLVDHFRSDRLGRLVHQVDLVVRVGLVVGLLGVVVYTVAVDRPFGVTTHPAWLAGKVAAYALCIACGVAIRLRLTGFGPAWAQLLRTGSDPTVETALRRSLSGTLPFVYAIWGLVFLAAVLGVVQPGSTAP